MCVRLPTGAMQMVVALTVDVARLIFSMCMLIVIQSLYRDNLHAG